MQEVDSKMLVDALVSAITEAIEEAKKDIRNIAELVNYECQNKLVVGGKYFDEQELRENMNACYEVLRRNTKLSPETKLRSARFCKEAAIRLKPKNEMEIVSLCNAIINIAERNTNSKYCREELKE